MFGTKKDNLKIDKDQLELIEYAQKRIKQKKTVVCTFCFVFNWFAIFNSAKSGTWLWKNFQTF